MGRFINADGYASTGQGLLGNNMFAYCGNNPTNYTDNKGTYPVCASPDIPYDVVTTAGIIVDRFQRVKEEKEKTGEMTFIPKSDGGGQLRNSFTLGRLDEMAEYSYYLVNESEYADSFQGNYEAVFLEWVIHDVACYVPFLELEKGMHVDWGYTIFDDDHPGFNALMWGVYAVVYPEQYQEDLITYMERS